MGHTLLAVLGLFLLNTLLYGHAEGTDAVLEVPEFTLFEGDSVTLRCKHRTTQHSMTATFYKDGSLIKMDTNHWSSTTGELTVRVSVSDEGWYKCQFADGTESEERELRVKAGRRSATLTADRTIIPLGGNVTLTCSVEDPAGFRYQWFRQTSDYSGETSPEESYRVISQGGKYTCRGWRSEPHVITPESNEVVIKETGTDAVLEVPEFTLFEGDSVTLRCKHRTTRRTMTASFYKDGSLIKMDRNHRSSTTGELTVRVSVSDEGWYKCKFADGTESEERELRVKAGRRSATLTADRTIIPLGDSVTLTCSVEDPAGFRYQWFRQTSDSSGKTSLQIENVQESFRVISQGGKYTCRGWRREPDFVTPDSNAVVIEETVSNRATLTLQPNWPQIFRGETITLRCDIQGGGDNQWMYEWTKDNLNIQAYNEHRIISATEADSGEYRCKGRRDSYSSTRWSDVITLTVSSNRPKAELRADDRVIPVGGSVTLTCSVKPSSSGWKYFWYRGEKTSEPLSSQLSAGPIRVSEGGVYWCRGGRGDPVYYTEYSDPVTMNKKVPNKAVVTLQPNWSEIFRGETITLRCDIQRGGVNQWTYEWTKDNLNRPTTYINYRIIRVTSAHSGEYRCKGRRNLYSLTEWSDVITLTVSPNRPKAELRADDRDIPVGGSVTLTCSVKPSSSGWKYFWYRGEKTSEPLSSQLSAGPIRVSEGGVYWCRGGRGDPVYYTEYSDPVTISNNGPNKAVVTLQPNWSEIFRGERITLRCEIKDGGDTEWEYEWRTTSSEKPSNQNELSIRSVSASHSGVYRCKGRKKREKSSTDWSDPFILTVTDKAQSVLTVSPSWLSAGASVTLNCRVKDQSAGWRFYWYKTVPDPSDNFYSYELLPGSSSGTEQDSYIVDGQTHTAGYVCRAGRGDPVFYTDYSQPQFVWSADFHSSASLTVSPDRAQHFTSDSVSLSCEGNSTEWRVRRSPENRYLSDCSTWGTMTGSTCKLKTNWLSDAVYWCESGSGEFSNSVNITIQNENMILLSPARPVTEGDSVSLSCKLRSQTFDSTVFFYHNEKVIQSDTRWELNISAVSKSDEGFYKCHHSGQESAQSWMSVQVSRPEHSSFPVLLIVGLICGIVLILLLLLLYRYRASKYTCFKRPIQSESSNTDQNEAQCSTYDSPQHGDVCLYETIKHSEDSEHVAGGSQDVTYSLLELRNFGKKRKQHTPEERSVYSDVRTGAADDSLLYAQVFSHDKGKKKNGRSAPAAADETFYSEVKPGSSLGL
ncbi:Fc receptor-like protein 5 isoform 2-T2 [Acanthopagrus schlegelii]